MKDNVKEKMLLEIENTTSLDILDKLMVQYLGKDNNTAKQQLQLSRYYTMTDRANNPEMYRNALPIILDAFNNRRDVLTQIKTQMSTFGT